MTRALRIAFLLGLAAVVMVGCFKHRYTVGTGAETANVEPTYSGWQSHWFFGIFGEGHKDLNEVCPLGDATIKDHVTFLNGLIGTFIGIVWYPTTIEIYCGDGSTAAGTITLTPEEMQQVALRPATRDWAASVSPELADELTAAIEAHQRSNESLASTGSPVCF